MPPFVAGFAAFFTGATVVGVVGTLGYLAAVAVFNAALGAIARKLTSKKESNTGQEQQREVTVRATDAYDVFVYGRALVGGVTVYHNGIPDANGINNRMHHVVKWAGHECTSISLFRLDDRQIDPDNANVDWDPNSYTGTGLVQAGQFRGTATASGPTYLRWYLGDQSSADARLNTQASEWTNSHVGHAQTYGVLEIWQVDEGEQTSKVFQKGFPGNIAANLHGKKIYDHRYHALNGNPGLQNLSSYWFAANGATTVSGDLAASSDNWNQVEGIGGVSDAGIANSSAVLRRAYSDLIAVDPGSTYSLRLDARDLNASSRALRANVLDFTDAGAGIAAQAWVNTRVPGQWTEFNGNIGGGGITLSDSARFIRIGLEVTSGNGGTMHLQAQDYAVYLGTGSRHLVDVASTWEYSESPPFCVADYLKDERLGFGKRLRIPINPSRYARNSDPAFRRQNVLNVPTYWRGNDGFLGTEANSGFTGTLSDHPAIFSLALLSDGTIGRRALSITDSGQANGATFVSDFMPIDPSGHYFISVYARQPSGNRVNFLSVAFLDSNGSVLADSGDGDWSGGTFHHFISGQAFAATWSNFTVSVGSGTGRPIPNSARFASVGALCARSVASPLTTIVEVQDYRLMVGTQDRNFVEPHEQIYWPSVSSAAAYTDALVATPSGTQVRFACNGAGHTGLGHRENVRNLLSSFNGRAVYIQSGFWIGAGWEEPSKILGKSDFRSGGALKIRAKAEIADRYNHVRGTFYDPVNEFKSVPFANVTAPEYVARDSSQQLFHDVDLPFTNDWFMAQRIAFGILEQGDNQQLVEFQLKHSALDLMPGRVVGINHDVVSWQNHTLRMVDMQTDLKKGVTLIGREDYAASYVDPSTAEYFSRTFNGVTSAAPIVPQVSSVALTPRDGGVQLRWANPAARSFEWIDVYRRTTNAFSGSTLIKSTRNDEYFDTMQAGQTQFYWFRSRDFAGNVSSIYPGLTSSFSAAGLFPVARDPEYVFFEEFRYQSFAEYQQKWELVEGTGDVTFINTGTVGGRVLQSSEYTKWTSRIRIPYDQDALYQVKVKVRQTNSVDAERGFTAGFTGYRADGTTPIDVDSNETLGREHAFVSVDQPLNSLDLWQEFIGHVRGHMPWPTSGTVYQNASDEPKLAARMHNLVRYVAPTFVTNNRSGSGTGQVDYFSVRKLTPYRTVTFDPEITAQSNWIAAPNVAGLGTSSSSVQSIVNVNVNGEYSVLATNGEMLFNGTNYFISERFRPDFHPRMPSSGAVAATVRARVTSDAAIDQITFTPCVIGYTRTGSAVGFFTGLARLTVGSDASLGPGENFNQWHEAGGTIRIGSSSVVNPSSGPHFMVPGCRVGVSPALTNSPGAMNSSWIAYLNITPGNP